MKPTLSQTTYINKLITSALLIEASWDDFVKTYELKNDAVLKNEAINLMIIADTIRELCIGQDEFECIGICSNIAELINEYLNDNCNNKGKEQEISAHIEVLKKYIESKYRDSFENEVKQKNDDQKIVLLLCNEEETINDLTKNMNYYGFEPKIINKVQDLYLYANSDKFPRVILLDLDLLKEWNMTIQTFKDMLLESSTYNEQKNKIVVLSSECGFETRLSIVRSKMDYLFSKPINPNMLMDKIDTLFVSNKSANNYRVLLIEDSETMIRFVKRTLEMEAMRVESVSIPSKAVNKIIDFAPDLILMDMYMPECDGLELARIIRQYESFTGTPIVFLSNEQDIKKQMTAMQIGADDFLTKPIQAEHLVAAVTTRIERHRILSSFIKQDSLTGLLNHTHLKRGLESLVDRAKRTSTPVSFAMVDIDFFKKVNDTYGHYAGDRVIKSLARLLKNRLRKTDIVGRYGGEEFAVALWNTTKEQAYTIIDGLREDFSKIEHKSDDGDTFKCSFSSGVASYPEFESPIDLSLEADKALYDSKHGGRNMVSVATKKKK